MWSIKQNNEIYHSINQENQKYTYKLTNCNNLFKPMNQSNHQRKHQQYQQKQTEQQGIGNCGYHQDQIMARRPLTIQQSAISSISSKNSQILSYTDNNPTTQPLSNQLPQQCLLQTQSLNQQTPTEQQKPQRTKTIKQQPIQQKQRRTTVKMTHKSKLIQIQKQLLQKITTQNDNLKLTIEQLHKITQKMKKNQDMFNKSKEKMKLKHEKLSLEIKRNRCMLEEKNRWISQMKYQNEKLKIQVASLEKYKLFSVENGKRIHESSLSSRREQKRLENLNNLVICSNATQFIYQSQWTYSHVIQQPDIIHKNNDNNNKRCYQCDLYFQQLREMKLKLITHSDQQLKKEIIRLQNLQTERILMIGQQSMKIQNLIMQISQFQQQNAELRKQHNQQRQKVAFQQQFSGEIQTKLQKQLTRYKEDNSILTKDKSNLQQQLQTLYLIKQEYEDKLNTMIPQLQQSIQQYKNKCQQDDKLIMQLKHQLIEEKINHHETQTRLNSLEQDNLQLIEIVNIKTIQQQRLNDVVLKMQEQLVIKEEGVQRLKGENKQLREQVEKLKQRLSQIQIQRSTDVIEQQRQHSQIYQIVQSINSSIIDPEKLHQIYTRLQELQAANSQLSQQKSILQENILHLQQQYNNPSIISQQYQNTPSTKAIRLLSEDIKQSKREVYQTYYGEQFCQQYLMHTDSRQTIRNPSVIMVESIVSLSQLSQNNSIFNNSRVSSLVYSDIRNSQLQSQQRQRNDNQSSRINQWSPQKKRKRVQTLVIVTENMREVNQKSWQYIEEQKQIQTRSINLIEQQQQNNNHKNNKKFTTQQQQLLEFDEIQNNEQQQKQVESRLEQYQQARKEQCISSNTLQQQQRSQQQQQQTPIVNINKNHNNNEDIPQILTQLKSQINSSLNSMRRISQSLHQHDVTLSINQNLQSNIMNRNNMTKHRRTVTQLSTDKEYDEQKVRQSDDEDDEQLVRHSDGLIEMISKQLQQEQQKSQNTHNCPISTVVSNLLVEVSMKQALLEIVFQQLETGESLRQENSQLREEICQLREIINSLQQDGSEIGRQMISLLKDKQENVNKLLRLTVNNQQEETKFTTTNALEEVQMLRVQLQQQLLLDEGLQQSYQEYAIQRIDDQSQVNNNNLLKVNNSNPSKVNSSNESLPQNSITQQQNQYLELISELEQQLNCIKQQLTQQHSHHQAQQNQALNIYNTLLNKISAICMGISEYVQNYEQLSFEELLLCQQQIMHQIQSIITKQYNQNNSMLSPQQLIESLSVMFNNIKYRLSLLSKLQSQKYLNIQSQQRQIAQLKNQLLQKQSIISQQKQYIIKYFTNQHNIYKQQQQKQRQQQEKQRQQQEKQTQQQIEKHHHDNSQLCQLLNSRQSHMFGDMINELQLIIAQKEKHTSQMQDKLLTQNNNQPQQQTYATLDYQIDQQQQQQPI